MLKLDVIKTLEDLKNSKIVEIEADVNQRFTVNYKDIVNFEEDEILDVPANSLRFLYSSIAAIRHVS